MEEIEIEQAAKGCVSGTLDEWPGLNVALRNRGIILPKETIASTLRKICQLLRQQLPQECDHSDRFKNVYKIGCLICYIKKLECELNSRK